MRKAFPGYYRPTEDEFSELWNTCLFVLDANVLLNLYRYSQETKEELIGILEEISDRLWIPYQAALEYHRNRLEVIEQQAAAYDKIQKLLNDAQNKLGNELRSSARSGRHPFIEADHLLERIKNVFTEIKEELKELKQEHPELVCEDPIRDAITALLEGKIGSPYPPERMREIYKEGKARYESEIPPGYSNANKGGTRQYGDLVLWFQVIDKAKEVKKPMILITDDMNDDWWLRHKGQIIGPQPELVGEIFSKADVSFHMYSADPFMEHARKYLERQVKQEAIDEVRDVRQRDEEYLKALPETVAFPWIIEYLKALQEGPLTTAYPQVHKEYLKALQEAVYTRTEAPAFRIPDETLRTMQQAQEAAMQVVSGITDKALRAMQQQAQEAAMQAVSLGITDKALRAIQQQAQGAMQAAVLGTAEGATESTAEDGTISLDSEPEEEPDEPDEQSGVGDR